VCGAGIVVGAALAFALTNRQPTGQPVSLPPSAASVATGTLTVDSNPSGAEVVVDGVMRGTTPLRLALPAGQRVLELGNGTAKRFVPLLIEPNAVTSHYFELAPPINSATGRLEVTSEPTGAQVRINGVPRGVTPLTIDAISAGQHSVTISHATMSVQRRVLVTPGATANVIASMAPAGTAGGWVAIQSPFELQVFENGDLIGMTGAQRLMLPLGRHELELVNASLEFSTKVSVQVTGERTTEIPVAVPNGSLSLNALPWADVWIDERPVGTTPLGNLAVPIGSHEVIWRHPQLGERRRTITVTARSPVRIGTDFAQ
jgi:hypothetical protein